MRMGARTMAARPLRLTTLQRCTVRLCSTLIVSSSSVHLYFFVDLLNNRHFINHDPRAHCPEPVPTLAPCGPHVAMCFRGNGHTRGNKGKFGVKGLQSCGPLGAVGLQTLHTKLPYITPSMTISSKKHSNMGAAWRYCWDWPWGTRANGVCFRTDIEGHSVNPPLLPRKMGVAVGVVWYGRVW